MSISIYIDNNDETEMIPVAGQNEINDLWMPIIRQKGLELLKVTVSGGVQVIDDVYWGLINELVILLHEIETHNPPTDYPLDASARLRRLLDTLKQHPPSSGSKLFLG
jgi:hypothetical protein